MKQLFLFDGLDDTRDVSADIPTHWKLFVDGASRNNPGPAGAGIYLLKDGEVERRQGYFLGIKTNNEAEYLALILGLLMLDDLYKSGDSVRVISDSKLLVHQIDGTYRVKKAELKPLHRCAMAMVKRFSAHVDHVFRTENTVADKMANHGVDRKIAIPGPIMDLLHRYEVSI